MLAVNEAKRNHRLKQSIQSHPILLIFIRIQHIRTNVSMKFFLLIHFRINEFRLSNGPHDTTIINRERKIQQQNTETFYLDDRFAC